MTAADHLGVQFKYEPPDERDPTSRYGRGHHNVQATINAPFDVGIGKNGTIPKGSPVKAGEMTWRKGGKILDVTVDSIFQRQGVGRAMFEHAQSLAAGNARIPSPKHSNDRTDAGDAFARAVGGRVPRKLKNATP